MDNSPRARAASANSPMEREAGGDAEQTAERNVWHYGKRKAIAA
jgi:hypothetical protein